MNGFFSFIASPTGRGVPIIVGVALIVIGLAFVQGIVGWILAIVGLAPLGAGVFDKCIVAALFGLPFAGPSLRSALKQRRQSGSLGA
jgi:hypothetical protein